MAGREVVLLESASMVGTGTSSRNSEVIHAGIYYPPGSLKARLCVEGKQRLYRFCDAHGVTARVTGKLIVATDAAQVPALAGIAERAAANGVRDLRWIRSAEDVKALEPQVTGVAALFSPSTGVVDSHGLMLALQGEAEAHGAVVAVNTSVVRGEWKESAVTGGGGRGARGYWSLFTADSSGGGGGSSSGGSSSSSGSSGGGTAISGVNDDELFELQCEKVVNCTGLVASDVALKLGCPRGAVPATSYAKGNYYKLVGVPPPFTHLVYPVPEAAGLGVHATVDLGGQVRFGPDVEWVDNPDDLSVDPARARSFYAAVREYWPSLPDDSLEPDYCGIRPKLQAPHSATALDFMIQGSDGPGGHGQPGLVNLFGIESPGLTSSMAIADFVASMVLEEPAEEEDRRMSGVVGGTG